MKLFDNNSPQVNQTVITSVAICLVFIMVVINRNSPMKKYLIPVLILAGIVLLIVSAITFIILHTKDQKAAAIEKAKSDRESHFYSEFQEEAKDLVILVKEPHSGTDIIGRYLQTRMKFIAYIDTSANELRQEQGTLVWLENGADYHFQKLGMYKVRVHAGQPDLDEDHSADTDSNRYLLSQLVVDGEVFDSRLEAVRTEYKIIQKYLYRNVDKGLGFNYAGEVIYELEGDIFFLEPRHPLDPGINVYSIKQDQYYVISIFSDIYDLNDVIQTYSLEEGLSDDKPNLNVEDLCKLIDTAIHLYQSNHDITTFTDSELMNESGMHTAE